MERAAVKLNRSRRIRLSRQFLYEVALIASVYVLYTIIRAFADGRDTEAIARGMEVVAFEQTLGIYHEQSLQSLLLNFPPLLNVLNFMYTSAHLPPLLLFAVWSFHVSQQKYRYLRTAFLISAGLGLLIYWLIPTAPPRLLPATFGFVDTVRLYGPLDVYDPNSSGQLVNEFAAIPSLHFAWATMLGVGFAWIVEWRWYGLVVAVAWPATILLVIVGTANHFLVDALAGLAVMGVAFALSRLVHDRLESRRERQPALAA